MNGYEGFVVISFSIPTVWKHHRSSHPPFAWTTFNGFRLTSIERHWYLRVCGRRKPSSVRRPFLIEADFVRTQIVWRYSICFNRFTQCWSKGLRRICHPVGKDWSSMIPWTLDVGRRSTRKTFPYWWRLRWHVDWRYNNQKVKYETENDIFIGLMNFHLFISEFIFNGNKKQDITSTCYYNFLWRITFYHKTSTFENVHLAQSRYEGSEFFVVSIVMP